MVIFERAITIEIAIEKGSKENKNKRDNSNIWYRNIDNS